MHLGSRLLQPFLFNLAAHVGCLLTGLDLDNNLFGHDVFVDDAEQDISLVGTAVQCLAHGIQPCSVQILDKIRLGSGAFSFTLVRHDYLCPWNR